MGGIGMYRTAGRMAAPYAVRLARYEEEKRRLRDECLTAEEYERRVREAAARLKI